MLLLVLFAFLVSIFQIFLISSPARSISWRYALIAFVIGTSASTVLALLAEQGFAWWMTNNPREYREIANVSGYRQDPLIEELCKLLPLSILVVALPCTRRSLSLTDIIVLAATIGAGFGFMECALGLGTLFSKTDLPATLRDGFFLFPAGGYGLNKVAVPTPWVAAGSWLPLGFSIRKPGTPLDVMFNAHMIYSIITGGGLAVIVNKPKLWWVGVLAMTYGIVDHLGYNADAANFALPFGLSPYLEALRQLDGVFAFSIFFTAIFIDRAVRQPILAADSTLRISSAAHDRFAMLRLVMQNLKNIAGLHALWHFILARRAYLTASASAGESERLAALHSKLAAFVRATVVGQANTATGGAAEYAKNQTAPTTWRRFGSRLLVACLVIMSLPPLFYWGMVGFVSSSGIANVFSNSSVLACLLWLAAIGVLMQITIGIGHVLSLIKRSAQEFTHPQLWHGLGLIAAPGGAGLGLLTLSVSIGKEPLASIGASHAIDKWLFAHPAAALALAIAVAVLGMLVPLAVGVFLPEIAWGIGVVQAITGKDLLIGQKLSIIERSLGLIPGFKFINMFKRKEIIAKSIRVISRDFQAASATWTLTKENFPKISLRISQKQLRHLRGRAEYAGSGYLDSIDDAQAILDAYHSGKSQILGKTSNGGFPVVRVEGVKGMNVNLGAGYIRQPTNVFIIKGTIKPSIVPTNPNWRP